MTPNAIADHCKWFAETVPSKGFQMGMLSPILNALKPDAFSIINNKPRCTLSYLTGKEFDNSLQAYPGLNTLALNFQAEHSELLNEVAQDTALPGDVFDMFCHWLVAIRKFNFTEAKVL